MWMRPVGSNVVSCSSHADAVTDVLLHTPQQWLAMHFSGPDNPKIAPSPWVIWTPCNTWFLRSTKVYTPIGILIGSAVFFQCSATRPRDRQTYRPRYSICSNRPHLASLLLRCGLKPEAKKSAAGSVQGERWIIWKIKFQTMTYELTVNIIYVKFVAVFVRVTWAWNPPYMILNHTQ